MSASLLWLDGHTAKVFAFSGESVTHQVYHRHEGHHANKHTLKHDKEVDHFYHEIADHLGGAETLLLLGPGEAKHQFVHHLEHHHHGLARRILAVENADHPSDDQLVAHGRAFFARHSLPT